LAVEAIAVVLRLYRTLGAEEAIDLAVMRLDKDRLTALTYRP
jgi:hypothetical protein